MNESNQPVAKVQGESTLAEMRRVLEEIAWMAGKDCPGTDRQKLMGIVNTAYEALALLKARGQ